ncbi:MAG TPA: hypothetical protein VH092_28160 [Urbifossiella sp.]|jgi:hypothetical protein|nr:hypothetical protein [Urbifossiella sp.]
MTDGRLVTADREYAPEPVCPGDYRWDGAVGDAIAEPPAGTWRNPPPAVRVGLVAAVWILPGVIVGLLGALALPGSPDPTAAGVLGASLAGATGAWIESRD